ncbi:MAG: 7-carboxy-7-deazaguanine synthase QueE [Flavobacteriales bacterium]|jgi:7-carboxy-7-deazaguanine synthase|nr:7-carboxy-7-deazaguanine synthase QueE [Flavobacteriales bacterium]
MKVEGLTEEMASLLAKGNVLPIMEEFYTIQGEGFHTGTAAYFIRIGGCDVGCHWCDVKESWDASIHPLIPIGNVVQNASEQPSKVVVVTGGEPLIFNLNNLTHELSQKGIKIHVETSGAHPFSGKFDWVCLSPKKTAPPKQEYYALANELKVIVYNRHDFEWANEHAAKVSDDCKLYLQPEWSKREEVMPLIVDYVMKNPRWNVSIQTHKYMNIP